MAGIVAPVFSFLFGIDAGSIEPDPPAFAPLIAAPCREQGYRSLLPLRKERLNAF
jgi:hypothetical protein